jgi:histone deacetylase complex regulatory component SIN3
LTLFLNRIGTKQVLERTTRLFSGHRSLIQRFIQFLPPGHVLQKTTDLEDSTSIEIKTPSGDLIIVDSTRGIVDS